MQEHKLNISCRGAGYIFFTYARFLIKITSTSQTACSGSQHFLSRINNLLPLGKKSFDQKLTDTLTLVGFSMFGLTILNDKSDVTYS